MLDGYNVGNSRAATSAVLDTNVGAYRREAIYRQKPFSGEISALKASFRNHLLNALPDEEFARLLPFLQTVSISGGENIFFPDGANEFIYFPETAVFSQLNVLEDGRTIETAMIGNEGVAGISSILNFQSPAPWTQTSIAGSALRIRTEIFKQEFSRGSLLQTAVFDYLNAYIAQISQRVICYSHHRIEERFSNWLLMLDDRHEKEKLSLTHEQISCFLGVHRPSVTCIAQDLRDGGIIGYTRGQIFILDRQKLKNTACECYSAINPA